MTNHPEYKTEETVHVISLDRTPHRYDLFLRLNSHLKLVKVSACEGATLNKEDCIRQGVFGANLAYSMGAMGSAISHLRLWREAVVHNEYRHIAEDDAIIRRDFQNTFHILQKERPDWEFILWSYNDDWPVGLVSTFGRVAALIERDISTEFIKQNYKMFQNETKRPALMPLSSAAGIGFYSISPAGARKMLESCLPLEGKPAKYAADTSREWLNGALDVEMSRHYQTMEAYLSYPPLAIMINDSANSTICGAEAIQER